MENPTMIDIIILSYAFNEKLKQVTTNCVSSLIASEDETHIKFKVLVIESYKGMGDYQYPNSRTIYPEQPFGYHRYMNIGINLTDSPYVCLCNNDLIFHKEWASAMLKCMETFPELISLSPVSSILHPAIGVPLNSGIKKGYRIGVELTGWCLFMKRTLFSIIGQLDENYIFTGADHDYANVLAVLGLKHALVTSAVVDHFDSTTLHTQPKERQDYLNLVNYHYQKWGHRILPIQAQFPENLSEADR
ncbi:glycosyltransferase family 2 protein [Pedobacter sp. AW31-3R]|uniref:glycosyltransferase family 2 protein n=1 Tax=Pedobacter sp. AW31-3R TaxID=3445781 RepID=UPI003F9FF8F1